MHKVNVSIPNKVA